MRLHKLYGVWQVDKGALPYGRAIGTRFDLRRMEWNHSQRREIRHKAAAARIGS